MIVLDEQIQGAHIREPIESWYKGQVISVRSLRRQTTIQDDAVPMLLRTVAVPTFVTINVIDFWQRVNAERSFAIVCIELPGGRAFETPFWLRRLFALPQFKTKAKRMGMIALLRATRIEYYRQDHNIKTIEW